MASECGKGWWWQHLCILWFFWASCPGVPWVWLVSSASCEPRAGAHCWPRSPSTLGCEGPTLYSLPIPTRERDCDLCLSCLGWVWLLFSLKERVALSEPVLRYLYKLILPFCSVGPSTLWDTESLSKFSPQEARTSSGCPWTPLKCPGSLTLWPWSCYLTFYASISAAVKQEWKQYGNHHAILKSKYKHSVNICSFKNYSTSLLPWGLENLTDLRHLLIDLVSSLISFSKWTR